MTWDISAGSLLGRAEGGLCSGQGKDVICALWSLTGRSTPPASLISLKNPGEARAGVLGWLVQQREGSVENLVHLGQLD